MGIGESASSMMKAPSYAWNFMLLAKSTAAYWRHYFGNRRFPDTQEYYAVYTSLDHAIPFQPDCARDYWLINLRLVPTSVRLGHVTGRFFRDIRRAYVQLAREGAAAFRAAPTIMPHLDPSAPLRTGPGQALHAARTLLKPVNCCPSLHTASPFFAYNLGVKYLPEGAKELRGQVGDVVSTIIRAKFHAMIDVAFGLFLAKQAIEGFGMAFSDLEAFFTQEQESKDRVPYEHVYRMYREIVEMAGPGEAERDGLPALMERYFRELGLPKVTRERSNCFYDLERKTLVYPPELKVGKGLL